MESKFYNELTDLMDDVMHKYLTNPTFLTGLGCGLSVGLLCILISKSYKRKSNNDNDEKFDDPKVTEVSTNFCLFLTVR